MSHLLIITGNFPENNSGISQDENIDSSPGTEMLLGNHQELFNNLDYKHISHFPLPCREFSQPKYQNK